MVAILGAGGGGEGLDGDGGSKGENCNNLRFDNPAALPTFKNLLVDKFLISSQTAIISSL